MKSFKEDLDNQDEYKEFNPDTKEKAEQLEKLMDQVLTPEMQDLMQKLQDCSIN
jgi:hypothetical protein